MLPHKAEEKREQAEQKFLFLKVGEEQSDFDAEKWEEIFNFFSKRCYTISEKRLRLDFIKNILKANVMKKKEEPLRNYKCTDATLKQTVDTVIESAERDIAEFNSRGVPQGALDGLGAEAEAFSDLPTDEEMEGDVGIAVQRRNEARDLLDNKLNTLQVAAENRWGVKDARYRKFSFDALTVYDDDDFYRFAKRALRVATSQAADLASKGIDAVFLTDLGTLITVFDDGIDAVKDAEKERNIAAQVRLEAGNNLHKGLLEVCRIGKDIWHDVNEAKYNDYVLDNYWGGDKPDLVKTGNVGPNMQLYVNTNNAFISNNTDITVEIPAAIPAGSVLKLQYSNLENGAFDENRNFVEVQSQTPPSTHKSVDFGFNKITGFVFLILYANGVQTAFKITVKQ